MKIAESNSYINWRDASKTMSSVPVTWDPTNIDIPWEKVIQTEEVPIDDPWDSYTTDLKHQLSKLHNEWKIPNESVVHYMSFLPSLELGLKQILEFFKNYNYSYNFLKLTPGHMVVWHFDTYATFVKNKNISQDNAHNIKRSVVLLTSGSFGHVIQVGKDVFSNWNAGDVVTWNNDTWHGACNFGKDDMILMQVTYIE
jgi:hypothetical protein